VFAVTRGLSPDGIAYFMAAAIFGGLALQWPIGLLSDRIDRRAVILGAAVATAVASAAIVVIPSGALTLLLLLVAVFGGVSFTLYPLSLAHAGDRLVNNEDMVGLSSGMLLLYSVGAAIGPLVAGQIFDLLDGSGLFLFGAVIAAGTAAYGFWRMQQAEPVSAEQQVSFVAVPRTSHASSELDPRQKDTEPELNLGGGKGSAG
jgi:MFS family permease